MKVNQIVNVIAYGLLATVLLISSVIEDSNPITSPLTIIQGFTIFYWIIFFWYPDQKVSTKEEDPDDV